ncbi:MAG: hypothetical protein Q9226_009162 [Calogaya cf. arnoldii]
MAFWRGGLFGRKPAGTAAVKDDSFTLHESGKLDKQGETLTQEGALPLSDVEARRKVFDNVSSNEGVSPLSIYEAVDLSSSTFRILILASARNKRDHNHCTMQFVDLENTADDRPAYEALSYTWGKSPDRHIIFVDGLHFPITPNLDLALSYLRKPDEPRVLWIDALCIDQENLAEKNHQVRMMQSIYSKASRVLIWPGESDKVIRRSMAFLKRAEETEGSLLLSAVEKKRYRQNQIEAIRDRFPNELIERFVPGLEKIF